MGLFFQVNQYHFLYFLIYLIPSLIMILINLPYLNLGISVLH
nr:MAG TPA: hypothetical protein [Bacteriophage sp.]